METPRDILLRDKKGQPPRKIGEITEVTNGADGKTRHVKLGTGEVINYKENGQPDLTPYLYQGTTKDGKPIPNTVYIKLHGKDSALKKPSRADIDLASQEAGFTTGKNSSNPVPDGYTWHHNEEIGKMELVRTDVHWAAQHHGGHGLYKEWTKCASCYPELN